MNRVSAAICLILVTIAAVEFGLLGASAAGLTGGSDASLPPVGERFGVIPTDTPTVSPNPSPTPTWTPVIDPTPPQLSPPSVVSGITIIADPLAIECDGNQTSHVRVRILDVNGNPAPDGINVYFEAYNGNTEPYFAQTVDGYAETDVRFYDDIFPYGPNLLVHADQVQAGIRILCFPQSDECPLSPPSARPPCGPTPTPEPPPSPPEVCLTPPSVSPPCEPTTTPPGSPPNVSPPVRTTTPPMRTRTVEPRTRTVVATRTPQPHRCAEVNDSGRVTMSDIHAIARVVLRGQYSAAYDIDRDGRVVYADVIAAAKQFGRRC